MSICSQGRFIFLSMKNVFSPLHRGKKSPEIGERGRREKSLQLGSSLSLLPTRLRIARFSKCERVRLLQLRDAFEPGSMLGGSARSADGLG